MFNGAAIDAIKADEVDLFLAYYDALMAKLVEGSEGGSEASLPEEEIATIFSLHFAPELISWMRSVRGLYWWYTLYTASSIQQKAALILENELLRRPEIGQISLNSTGGIYRVDFTVNVSNDIKFEQSQQIPTDLDDSGLFKFLQNGYGVNGNIAKFVFNVNTASLSNFASAVGSYYDDASRDTFYHIGLLVAGMASGPIYGVPCLVDGTDIYTGQSINGLWRALCVLDLIPAGILAKNAIVKFVVKIGGKTINFRSIGAELGVFIKKITQQGDVGVRLAANETLELIDNYGQVIAKIENGNFTAIKSTQTGEVVEDLVYSNYQIVKAGDGSVGVKVVDGAGNWKSIQEIANKYPTEALPADGQLWGIAEIENGLIKQMSNRGNTFIDVDFVVTTNGELKIGKKHHFLGNAIQVEAAGTIKTVNGKIKKISNSSGHYFPTIEETNKFPEIFRQLGLETKGASLEIKYLDEAGNLKTQTKFITE